MSSAKLQIESGPVTTVQVVDKDLIDEAIIQDMGEQLLKLVENSDSPRIIVDFSSIEHLSSAALGMLIKVHNATVKKSGRLDLCGIIPDILEAFVITNLTRLFNIHDTLEDAKAASA